MCQVEDKCVRECVGSGLLFSIFLRVEIVEGGSAVPSYSLCKVNFSG